VQLLKIGDDYHLEFEVTDFEHKRSTFEWFQKLGVFPERTAAEIPIEEMNDHIQLSMGVFPGSRFQEACQIWTNIATTSVNRRLQFFNKGKKRFNKGKKRDNPKILAFEIIKFLWRSSGCEGLDAFQWVPLKEISRNLVKFQKVGRPRNENLVHQEYRESEELPIAHYTTLRRLLDDLVECELIERKWEIIEKPNKPQKKKENTFFRISKRVYESDVTMQETIDKLNLDLQEINNLYDLVSIRFLATINVLKKKGIEPPSFEETSAWIDEYHQGKIQL